MDERVEEWLNQADKDLETAQNLFEMNDFVPMVFRLQQTVEKGLKAFHIKMNNEYPYIHNLRELNTEVEIPERFEELLSELDAAYTTTRYPETAENLEVENPEDKLEQTEEVLEWIKKQLKK